MLTPVDLQQKNFSMAWGIQKDVDSFLTLLS